VTRIVRAGDRFRSEHGGITSWHCFSAGAHYDPENTNFGAVIAVDEHLVAPGSGFDTHAHAGGVRILSWVLEGLLRHEDDGGGLVLASPGQLLVQDTGDGLRHRETNASMQQPLRFVQTTLLADSPRSLRAALPPAEGFDVVRGPSVLAAGSHAFVARGAFVVDGVQVAVGDSVRVTRPVAVEGGGELLVVRGE
jgi:hypothetical protein